MTDLLTDLLVESRQRGFLGPGPVEDHLDHARAFAVAVPTPPQYALDLGAGGGLPGLVLAAELWPACRWVFLDAQLRRTAFLAEAVARLGLVDRVHVITDRAEVTGSDPELRGAFDLVVSRSFGAPAVVAECAAPLLAVGGLLVVSEPPSTAPEERWPSAGVAQVGLGPAEAVEASGMGDPVHLVRMRQLEICPERYPRRTGIPAKRPLF